MQALSMLHGNASVIHSTRFDAEAIQDSRANWHRWLVWSLRSLEVTVGADTNLIERMTLGLREVGQAVLWPYPRWKRWR